MAKPKKTKQETIPTKEVGSEIVEKAMQDNPDLPEEFVEEALKATEEFNNGETEAYISPSESITDVLEEKATVVLPEEENLSSDTTDSLELIPNDVGLEVVEDAPQTLIINLKHTDIVKMVKDILYISYLGGDLTKKFAYLRSNQFPYRVDMVLPIEAKEAWESREDEVVYEGDKDYYFVSVTNSDTNVFARKLVELGREGAVIPDKKTVRNGSLLQVKLALRNPVKQDGIARLSPKKVKYSREELFTMNMKQLKIVGEWYSVSAGAKATLAKAILDKQAELKWD